jgi:hypothetical protein
MHAATSKVENSAQGSSCKLKFVHVLTRVVLLEKEILIHLTKVNLIDQVTFYIFAIMNIKNILKDR